MSTTAALSLRGLHVCDNCGEEWPARKLNDITDLLERIDPGGVVPSGECPSCGMLCYPKRTWKSVKRVKPESFARRGNKIEIMLDGLPYILVIHGADLDKLMTMMPERRKV